MTRLVGLAAPLGVSSELRTDPDLGPYRLRFAAGAFDQAIASLRRNERRCPLILRHGYEHMLARTSDGLAFCCDDRGLLFTAQCWTTPSALAALAEVRRWPRIGASVRILIAAGGHRWTYEHKETIKIVSNVESLIEVSLTPDPAFPLTRVELSDGPPPPARSAPSTVITRDMLRQRLVALAR